VGLISPTADPAAMNAMRATLKAAAFGEIMSVLLQSERHRHVTLETLARQMVPAYLSEQYVIARAKPDHSDAPPAPVGIVFWASVSEEIDRRLTDRLAEPFELEAEDWRSGNIVWLVDIVAAQNVSAQLIKAVRDKVGSDKVIKVRAQGDDGRASVRTITG
jgi:cytolysin-activating lysine-acyltransferase